MSSLYMDCFCFFLYITEVVDIALVIDIKSTSSLHLYPSLFFYITDILDIAMFIDIVFLFFSCLALNIAVLTIIESTWCLLPIYIVDIKMLFDKVHVSTWCYFFLVSAFLSFQCRLCRR